MNTDAAHIKVWKGGDWNAFFGFGTNILVNMLVLTSLLRYVVKMPDALIFGRILPATGLMLLLSTSYYAWLAYRLAVKEGRNTVCALPSGIGVGHMFIVVFVIMMPIMNKTGDAIKAWEAGLAWVFIQSIILIMGGYLAPYVRKITPRAALLGTLAGISITFIAMRPALEMYTSPIVGVVCFSIILLSWFGGVRYPFGIPAGLIAIVFGTALVWGAKAFDLVLVPMEVSNITQAFSDFGFSLPVPAIGHVFSGFEFIAILLVTAIPFGIADLVEAMNNCESAEAAGDKYPTNRVVSADGVVSLIGCTMGNPFINAVYIGHPGWKAMGGGMGYSIATGLTIFLLSIFGLLSLILAVIPVVAILPILLYIGMLIGAQAFQESPKQHAPAIILALVPHIAAWVLAQINGALSAAGTNTHDIGAEQLMANGVLIEGLHVLAGGAILSGLVLAAIAIFMIDKDFKNAMIFSIAGSILSFFGFMHAEQVGVGVATQPAIAYLICASVLGCLMFKNSKEKQSDSNPVSVSPTVELE